MIFTGDCPRCGHRSLYGDGAERRCAWPYCDWPAEPRDHYSNFRFLPDGTVECVVTRTPKAAGEDGRR